MAPKRTRKKRTTTRKAVGLHRLHAAIDHFTPMGFSPVVIHKKVKELLKVYGGDEAWSFIEDGSYNILLEMLLEEQEKNECGCIKPLLKNDCSQGRMTVEEGVSEQAGPSSVDQVFSNQDAEFANLGAVPLLPPPPEEHHRQDHGCSAQRRRRCLGWMSSDGGDDAFVLLTPYPVSGCRADNRKGKHKRRWDLRPDDL
ncbi:hypothetical protein Nepgr_024959 [Nepenthes gracilis]|uniref:WIYLD domain-containing protein n=1 Tax=Nepenthes gracilis TaxID=150966 RepID=A0AAD3Y106_NEPGR|nr:hypothetical protein Nepgr_024959 [Nepenthes gracilis]